MATNENDSKANDGNNIIDPRETDVLCGRGGAALRHSGNQTYRRLVNLNKGLYITCLKTEKLKISRSIVAAIREQNGRFLERNAKLGVWCDIGDKKAIEKTSQALREGQPKLRKQMVERGEIPSDQLIGTDHVQQQYGNGIYNPRRQQQQQQQQQSMILNNYGGSDEFLINSNSLGFLQHQNQLMMMRRNQIAQQQFRNSMLERPTPPLSTLSTEMNDINEVAMLQRLSLVSTPQSIPSWTPSLSSVDFMDDEPQLLSNRSRSRSTFNRNTSYGGPSPINNEVHVPYTTGGDITFVPERIGSLDPSLTEPEQQQKRQQVLTSNDRGRSGRSDNIDDQQRSSPSIDQRRRSFAKMKAPRNTNGLSSRSNTDSMPDIYMVDSQFSLLSNLSKHESKHNTMDISIHGENKETIGSEYIGVGSRRSLMSGLSKLSGHSDINNVFSSMSKKIGGTNHNLSSRSIAMSEYSGIDEEFADDDFSFELPPSRTG